MGSIVQISVSRGGVPKRSVASAEITTLGISGDAHAHAHIHGGPRKAILILTSEGIDELAAEGFALYPGALGENLTTRGIDRRGMRAGQRYRTPNVVLELTQIRVPCEQLDIYGSGICPAVYDAQVKAGDPASPRWGLSGFYACVLVSGVIRTGDPLQLAEEAA